MAKRGRKRIEIDWQEFEKLCGLQCTLCEIAGWFQVSEDTVERRVKEQYKANFAEVFKLKRSVGAISLRRKQWQVAMQGNVTMLIWLGKNVLNQSDNKHPLPEEDIYTGVDFIGIDLEGE